MHKANVKFEIKTKIYRILYYVRPPNIRTKMYAGRVACCPMVSHVEYALHALLKLEKETGQTDKRTDRQTLDRIITLSARRGQRKNQSELCVCFVSRAVLLFHKFAFLTAAKQRVEVHKLLPFVFVIVGVTLLYNRRWRHWWNKVSPERNVTVLARRAVSATRQPTRPAGPPAGNITNDDRRRRQTTYASEQNNTGQSGGPVIIQPISVIVCAKETVLTSDEGLLLNWYTGWARKRGHCVWLSTFLKHVNPFVLSAVLSWTCLLILFSSIF